MRIAMWSGPRNISTAMMRAFENRADMEVWDEPFYAAYLEASGLEHPMGAEVIAAGETDWRKVATLCAAPAQGANRHGRVPEHVFQKHMTVHMLPGFGLDWCRDARHFFLIRAPEAVIASYHDRRADPEMSDLGYERQLRLHDEIAALTGEAPLVLESDSVLRDPEAALRGLCTALGLPFDPAMLFWPAGARETDGVWGAHWYNSVNSSTGFQRARAGRPLPDVLRPLAARCRPFYERLAEHAL